MARRKANVRPSTPEGEAAPPLYNVTFSTHRVSPLHVGARKLTQARLDALSRRLRDTLVGDVVRGIQIGLEADDGRTTSAGPLKAVVMRWFGMDVLGGGQGLCIQVVHENASYTALLLPGLQTGEGVDGVVHLPLMLLKMPQALKGVLANWLSTTFDCRVGKLTLGTKTLVRSLQGYLHQNVSDVLLTLAFQPPENEDAGLRSLEVTLNEGHVRNLLTAGGKAPLWEGDERERRRLAGPHADDGWAWRKAEDDGSFMEALAGYLRTHMALNIFHPSVRVTQVSCAGFVLAHSRVKIVEEAVARMLLTQLAERVRPSTE